MSESKQNIVNKVKESFEEMKASSVKNGKSFDKDMESYALKYFEHYLEKSLILSKLVKITGNMKAAEALYKTLSKEGLTLSI